MANSPRGNYQQNSRRRSRHRLARTRTRPHLRRAGGGGTSRIRPGFSTRTAETARKIAAKHGTRVFASDRRSGGRQRRRRTSSRRPPRILNSPNRCSQQGKHVLVEKPMTDNAAQAAELVQLAQQKNCVLQVGHVERFNPVFKYLETRRHRAALHREPPPLALPGPPHRHRRGARPDDSRSGRGAGVREIARDQRGCRGHSRVEQVRGHRQRAPALRQRLRRQPHRQPRQPGADAQDPRVQRPDQSQLHLARLPRAGGISFIASPATARRKVRC